MKSLLGKLKNLNTEKIDLLQEIKRLNEEVSCRFNNINWNAWVKGWPMLDERYQIVSLLGKGGFSEVYKAFDTLKMRWVACKIHQLKQCWSETNKANYIKHALRENKIHKSLSHVNIVELFDTIEIDKNSFCTVLEYCNGTDLSVFMKKNPVLPEKEAKLIIRQLLSLVYYLNAIPQPIIHYDIKPQNVLFHDSQIKLTDFGLSKIHQEETSKIALTSQGVGTYWYLPPECFQFGSDRAPRISSKVDIFSIGVIFYQLVIGKKPFGHKMS